MRKSLLVLTAIVCLVWTLAQAQVPPNVSRTDGGEYIDKLIALLEYLRRDTATTGTVTSSTATLDLTLYGSGTIYLVNNTVPVTITDITPCTAGYPAGKEITLRFGTANTTVSHNSRIHLKGMIAQTLPTDAALHLRCMGFEWVEVGRYP